MADAVPALSVMPSAEADLRGNRQGHQGVPAFSSRCGVWMLLLGLISLVLLCFAAFGACRHRARLRRIPIRIHVNGTRGKSGVTRLIVAGLRAGGFSVLGKTTGTAACLLEETGERPFRRSWLPAPASIREQARLVCLAVRQRVTVLVSECMAVHPEIQTVSEAFFLRATHTVITNVRHDHGEVMGDTLHDVAQTLAHTVPHGGTLILGTTMAEETVFTKAAQARSTHVVHVPMLDTATASSLPYSLFADNVATALTVCSCLGVARETALQGMLQATPDSGELSIFRAGVDGRPVWFINAFAANDPHSTRAIWQRCRTLSLLPPPSERVVIGLANTRADRGDRLASLALEFVGTLAPNDWAGVLVLGDSLLTARRLFLEQGVGFAHIPAWCIPPRVPALIRCALRLTPVSIPLVLYGFGNMQGMGQAITSWFVQEGIRL